jgi:hypothetical protein
MVNAKHFLVGMQTDRQDVPRMSVVAKMAYVFQMNVQW